MLKRLAREPLVHFLLIGLGLFALFQLLGGNAGDRSIRVDDRQVAALAARFEATWRRPPTAEELRGMVDSHVRDEIFYREGVALGLDRDDPLVKRQVRRKFEVYAEEIEVSGPPTEQQLEVWLQANRERYSEPAVVTFQQVTIDPLRHDRATESAVAEIRSKLLAGADPAMLGDGRMLSPRIDGMPLDLVARDFGDDFAKALADARVGGWEGPVRSGFGFHLIRLERRVPGRTPALAEVRAAVARDWEADRRTKSLDAYYQRLREEYDVELPASLPAAAPAR